MHKVCDWIFGSFFRTLGKILVFVILGIIISNIINFDDIISNFNVTDLFFTKVDALSSDLEYIAATQAFSSSKDIEYSRSILGSPYDYSISLMSMVNFKGDVIGIPFASSFYSSDNGGNNGQIYQTDLMVYLRNTERRFNQFCEVQNNYFLCDIPDKDFSFNELHIVFLGQENFYANHQTILIEIQAFWRRYNRTSSSTTNAINNQTQQQQQQHQEMMDSNTTTAEDDAEGFFDDFEVDLGGLSGIITAPLSTIQSLLNSTCTNLVLPLPFVNSNLTLPCMDTIYRDNFGSFYTLYQTIILGIIAYRCIMSIFFDIKGFTNPSDDRIEVMDL